MTSVTGGCFCKKIKFEITFPTEFVSHCHCESCRKSHGSAFVTWSGVPIQQFKFLSGQDLIKKYQSSSAVSWCFCTNCGSSLLYEHQDSPNKVYFTVANLNGDLDRLAEGHVSYEEHVSWFTFKDNLPKFKEKTQERLSD